MPRLGRGAALLGLCLLALWSGLGLWHAVKPLPAGIHVASLVARLTESQVDFLYDTPQRLEILPRELAAIDRAEQLIVVDHCPLGRDLAQHLLARKLRRGNLKIVLITDPLNEVYGGTPAQYLQTLEQAGVIVSRVRLDRLRDSNPLYSGLWRLAVGWWSDPFEDTPGRVTLAGWLRRLNAKADGRQLLIADDGSGGWMSVVTSGPASNATVASGAIAVALRNPLAREIAASELQIAAWSTPDDRLPAPPAAAAQGIGSIDARFLTEGAVHTALLEAMASAGSEDRIGIAVARFSDRRLIRALWHAALRGVRVQLLLDPRQAMNAGVAAELRSAGAGRIEVRWYSDQTAPMQLRLAFIRHRQDLWVSVGSADFTRRSLGDFNLEANVELRMPARAAPARAINDYFAQAWNAAVDQSGTPGGALWLPSHSGAVAVFLHTQNHSRALSRAVYLSGE